MAEGGALRLTGAEVGEQVVDVRRNVLAPLGQPRQRVGPQIDAREQVGAETPGGNVGAQVAVGAGDELEVARHLAVGAKWVEAFFFDRLQQHGLFVGAEFADFVEKQHAAIRRAQ